MMVRQAAFFVGCALLLQSHAVAAESRISGSADAVRVEARQASLDEVLGALAAKYNLHYRAKVALGRPVNGIFSGSLLRVIARLLDGYDYVVQRDEGRVDVTIIGLSQKGPSSLGGEAS